MFTFHYKDCNMRTTVNIKKGWVIKKQKDKDGETIVATKKFFKPIEGGYSAGSIEYTTSYKTNKNKKAIDIEVEDEKDL